MSGVVLSMNGEDVDGEDVANLLQGENRKRKIMFAVYVNNLHF
jgi:hypothetical protein